MVKQESVSRLSPVLFFTFLINTLFFILLGCCGENKKSEGLSTDYKRPLLLHNELGVGVQVMDKLQTRMAKLGESNTQWIRTWIFWSDVEEGIYIGTNAYDVKEYDMPEGAGSKDPKQHSYNWTKSDKLFTSFQELGINHLIVTVRQAPQWAVRTIPVYTEPNGNKKHCDCGPLDSSERYFDLEAFLHAAAARYDGDGDYDNDGKEDGKAMPKVEYWELYNEPDVKTLNIGWIGGIWGGDIDEDGIPDCESMPRCSVTHTAH